MRRIILICLLGFGAALLPASPARAVGVILPGSYTLLDHGDGDLGPDYGLRVDSIGEIFSVELGGASLTLSWGGGATATIIGTVRSNNSLDLWDVDYTLTGVSAVGGNLGFIATGGGGTLTDPLNNVTALIALQNAGGRTFEFLADGYRLTGDDSTPVGRGWLQPPDTTDDWLVRAEQVPEPASLWLLGSALAALALRRRG